MLCAVKPERMERKNNKNLSKKQWKWTRKKKRNVRIFIWIIFEKKKINKKKRHCLDVLFPCEILSHIKYSYM